MKHVGRAAAFVGLVVSFWLIWREDASAVLALMRAAGAGLVLAGIAHVLPMLANAKDWQLLMRGPVRPGLGAVLGLVWIRESVNGLLPVARIGGEIVSFRVMRRWGMRPSTVVASLIVDTQLTLISQLIFATAGIAYLLGHAASGSLHVAADFAWGLVVLTPVLVLFSLVQHASPFERMTQFLNRMTSGKLAALLGESARIDQSIKRIWRQRGIVTRYLFVWQTVQCLATAFEIWLALYFLGAKVSFLEAFVLEALIQALSSVAFFVPGALGVQEGGFLLIGTALGLDPQICLALAGARRVRDLIIFLPGLFAWQMMEWRRVGRATQ
ncbi:lysylphosphatidylglycerol synthase domain-containing protein [Burkholderia guangdongensis]|uniref:lysylphosphatidylglycerol synthase domain-containing protein n=1 Tax=Burkholderia guangdongensis TaxID=1792500 RepID=UPI0015C752B2|nr:lysylphosphatidylglycerol synthase domain-containing protein [Burkholderia guangdongensis]